MTETFWTDLWAAIWSPLGLLLAALMAFFGWS